MISATIVKDAIAEVRNISASLEGLLSLTIHGEYAQEIKDRAYVDLDIIFLFDDKALDRGRAHVETYFQALIANHKTPNWRILYRAHSGPMHPLRQSGGGDSIRPLRHLPVLFFHISIFSASLYSLSQQSSHRPSRLLLYSWQFIPPLLGQPLANFAHLEQLTIDDVLGEGLGVRDLLDMVRNRRKNFWIWQSLSDGTSAMLWDSAPFEDMEIFDLPLYAFKWCIINCTRAIRHLLPLRADLPDLEIFERFFLTDCQRSYSQYLSDCLRRIEDLRFQYSENPNDFSNIFAIDELYISIVAVLEQSQRRLEEIKSIRPVAYSFSMQGQRVPILLTLDFARTVTSILSALTPDRIILVIDSNLAKIYEVKELSEHKTLLSPNDKNISGLVAILKRAEESGIGSDSLTVAMGGGNVGNTAGTAAGLICRGGKLFHIPTTLVAQLDSAIGGKQSVNGMQSKNYIGLYHAPAHIIVQPLFLLTLDAGQILDGLVEAMKHGLCQDDRLVKDVLLYIEAMENRPFDRLVDIVKRTINLKLEYLSVDPLENDPQTPLELGHKIGHAVEALSGGYISHGQSVAFGILTESILFMKMGKIDDATLEYIQNAVAKLFSAPSRFEFVDGISIAKQLRHDNKRRGNCVPFSYLERPQQAASCAVVIDDFLIESAVVAVGEAKEFLRCYQSKAMKSR